MARYAGVAPNYWVFCQGQLVSQAVYPQLFQSIGTAYGLGEPGTFRLPNRPDWRICADGPIAPISRPIQAALTVAALDAIGDPVANPRYAKAGDRLALGVVFVEPVALTGAGTPALTLTIGAGLSSLALDTTDSQLWTTTYTVLDGDNGVVSVDLDLDGCGLLLPGTNVVVEIGPALVGTVNVDTTAPATPTIAASADSNNSLPVLTGTATVGTDETLTLKLNGVTYTLADYLQLTNTTWTLPSHNAGGIPRAVLAPGTYTALVTTTDLAGNNAMAQADLTILPIPTVNTLSTASTTPTLTGTVHRNAAIGEKAQVGVGSKFYSETTSPAVVVTGVTWSLAVEAGAGLLSGHTYDVAASVLSASGAMLSIDATTNELTIT